MIKKICIGLSVVLVICLFSIGLYLDKNSRYTDKPKQEDKTFAIDIMQLDAEQYLVNAVIIEWMNGEYTAEQLYNSYRSKLGRLDSPAPVIIKFSVENIIWQPFFLLRSYILEIFHSITQQTLQFKFQPTFWMFTLRLAFAHLVSTHLPVYRFILFS